MTLEKLTEAMYAAMKAKNKPYALRKIIPGRPGMIFLSLY